MNVKCPHCDSEYEVEDKYLYRYTTCHACGKGFVIGTTFAKKMGEAANAAKDSAGVATRMAYEKVKSIDWKEQRDRARSMAGPACENNKKWLNAANSKCDEWGIVSKVRLCRQASLRAMRTLLSDSDAQHEQPQRDDAAQNTRLAQFRQLLASSPWQIQFSSAYIAAFGVALAICNLFASRFPSSVVPSLVATALALIVEYTLVRFCFVRWLLVVWGGFNIVLLLCGPREFSFLWPFNVSFVAVAALLVMPSVRQWYRREYLVDATSGFNSLKRVFATGVGLAIVASIILLSGYKSERNRTRKSRDGYSCKDSYESSYSPSVYSSSSSCGSPQNARGAIERALMNVKERYQNMLRRYNLVESLYIDREDMCQLILVEPSGDTPLYTIRYWKSSNELEWSRLIPRDVAEQFLHDRMLMDSYKKVLSSDK